jgi:hypothetical protein
VTDKAEFMAEYQSLMLAMSQNVATLATATGDEFDRLARRAAVMAHDPSQRLLKITNHKKEELKR